MSVEKNTGEGEEPVKDARVPESDEERDKARERARNYQFKIAPADPKNAFDFEDVADK